MDLTVPPRPICLLRLVVLMAAALGSGCATTPDPMHGIERLDSELERLERRGFVGQVVVVQDDHVLLNRGLGSMAPDEARPVTTRAVMPLASLTKPFTASAVLALAAEGRLGLDEPIGQHVPDLSEPWASIPIHHFLTHTAGLPAEIVNRAWTGHSRFEPVSRADFIGRLAHFEPDHPPGAGYNYSNVGYNLLAVLVEQVGESDFESFLVDTLLRPAGISGIGFLLPGWMPDQLVKGPDGHYFDQPRLTDGLGWNLRGAGDLLAEPSGIIAWWQSIRHQTWLSRPWLDEWLQPQVDKPDGTRYGFGLHFRDSRHGPVIGHTGGDFNFAVDFSWYTDHDLMIYIATASPAFEADLLRDGLHRRVLGGY